MKIVEKTIFVALLTASMCFSIVNVSNAQSANSKPKKSLVTKDMAQKVAHRIMNDNRSTFSRSIFNQANDIRSIYESDKILSEINNHLDCVENFIVSVLNNYGTGDAGYLALESFYFTPEEYDIAVRIYNSYNNTTKETSKVEDKPQQREKSEPMPSFAGGTLDTGGEIMKWIGKNIKYPEDAQEKGEQGRVTVKFHIDTDGTISNVNIERSVCPSIDKEAIRVVSNIPKKLIVKQNKDIVKGVYSMTIPFRLP